MQYLTVIVLILRSNRNGKSGMRFIIIGVIVIVVAMILLITAFMFNGLSAVIAVGSTK